MRELVVIAVVVFAYFLASDEARAASKDEKMCMALNIYHEARGEGSEGMIAVANVVVNRMRSKRYPSTACAVVYQHKQFSWTLDPHLKPVLHFSPEILRIASLAVSGKLKDNTGGALHFHATRIKPYWASSKRETAVIGNHVFYRPINKRKNESK
jgi:N-acetylmuramoyl-L-alanine amidase